MSKHKEQLDKEVGEYNELVGSIAGLREQLEQMEQNRLQRLGRIQVLSEWVSKETAEDAAENGVGDPQAIVVTE